MTASLPVDRERGDAACMERIASGDLGALGILFDRHAEAIGAFVSRALSGSGDVDDVVQETFLTAARVADRFDGRVSCRPFLLGIAARLVMQRSRKLARFSRALGRLARGQPASSDALRSLEARSSLRLVGAALARMSAAKRVVVLMAEVEGMSGPEIALALGIPQGTVWTRLHAARAELRAALGGAP